VLAEISFSALPNSQTTHSSWDLLTGKTANGQAAGLQQRMIILKSGA